MKQPLPWPRLSQSLHKVADLHTCQNCLHKLDVERWREHDERDRPEPIVVLLCTSCSAKIIEPHPRLYEKLHAWHPMPGSMQICSDCPNRSGTACTHPDLKANGGNGLSVSFPRPIVAFVDGRRGGRRAGWQETVWQGPPSSCAGHPEMTQVRS